MAKKFLKPDVDAKFEIVTEEPIHIHVTGYSGALENAPLKVVEGLVARKSVHVKAKVTGAAKPSGGAEKKD